MLHSLTNPVHHWNLPELDAGLDSISRLTTSYWKKMSTSQHTHQIVCNVLGHYIGVGMEDPEMPHQFPLQPPNLPTVPIPIEANTFVHIPDSPPHSPSPFQFPPQEEITQTLEEHPMEECSHSTPAPAPISRTISTNSGEILQPFVQVLTLLASPPP